MEIKSVEEYMERIRVLDALEQQAMGLSRMLMTYTDRLQDRLDQRVEIETASEEAVLSSIKHLEATVTKSVQQKNQLVEQCKQLDSEMEDTRKIVHQVQEIKQLLDVMEYAKRKK
ncbi:hypothetical protein EV175_001405 [Coemansia sp. RSA 1933]|nr:hypothetical protein EV175_001405 [Coemansia sp. RSA 1933]